MNYMVYRAGGRWFKSRPDQHSGSLRGESAAFVKTFCKRLDFLVFSDKDVNRRPRLTTLAYINSVAR